MLRQRAGPGRRRPEAGLGDVEVSGDGSNSFDVVRSARRRGGTDQLQERAYQGSSGCSCWFSSSRPTRSAPLVSKRGLDEIGRDGHSLASRRLDAAAALARRRRRQRRRRRGRAARQRDAPASAPRRGDGDVRRRPEHRRLPVVPLQDVPDEEQRGEEDRPRAGCGGCRSWRASRRRTAPGRATAAGRAAR